MGLLNTLQFGRMANDGYPEDLPEGHVCMNKVVEVEETIYDEEMRRVHAVCLTGDIQKGHMDFCHFLVQKYTIKVHFL